ncbi:GNAT family N-acetyltransferase [Aeromonas hydrophila]|uniref:GNAT family N-acetyltransferase n=1 Tax=Aeromonas hydrophila TaxID=644 RepID=UPI00256F0F91|nr:N-acetyltransferase [Aeromonas hydrophila]MDL5382606.1 N-acetyltransferase [Aeromonas hydrophila]
MLTVRAARTDDLGAIVKLERYCFPPEVAFGRSRWHYLLTHAKGRTLLVLDQQEQLMGYLCLLEHRGWDRLIIQTLAIRWTIRRQGWARRLLEQVIQEGKEGGWGAIRLEVGDANEEAQALYRELGFRPRQKLPDYYGHGQHAHRLVLKLAGERREGERG